MTSDSLLPFATVVSFWFLIAGEGSIPGIKERIKNMKKNFARNAVQGYLEAEALTKLLESMCKSIKEDENTEDMSTQSLATQCGIMEWNNTNCTGGVGLLGGGLSDRDGERVHRHKGGSQPVKNMHQVVPVLVSEQCGKIWYVEKGNNNKNNKFHQCRLGEDNGEELGGAWYFKFWEEECSDREREMFQPQKCLCGIMLQHRNKKSMYHVIRSDWKELLFDHTTGISFFDLPRYKKAVYNRAEGEDTRDERSERLDDMQVEHAKKVTN